MSSRRAHALLSALILISSLAVTGCAHEAGESSPTDRGSREVDARSAESGPCDLIEQLGAGAFAEAAEEDWADPSTLLTPALATWGLDELRAEPATSNLTDQEWAHHLSATVRGRTQGSLLAITATDPARREAAALLLAIAQDRIRERDRGLQAHLALNTVLLAEPRGQAWTEQVAGFVVQRPVSLRRVVVTVVLDAGPEGLSTNRDELLPILDELAAEQTLPIGEFADATTIPKTLDEVGLGLVVLRLDLEPLSSCSGPDLARLERNFEVIDSLLGKLDGALGFQIEDGG